MDSITFVSRTTTEDRRLLREAGFVHVSGLTEYKQIGPFRRKRIIGLNLKVSDLGRSQVREHMSIIVTLGGEIWISATFVEREHAQRELFTRLTPNRQRIELPPCTDGWYIPTDEILRRMDNPDCEPRPERAGAGSTKNEVIKLEPARNDRAM